jgi:hypothetical protein
MLGCHDRDCGVGRRLANQKLTNSPARWYYPARNGIENREISNKTARRGTTEHASIFTLQNPRFRTKPKAK